MAGDWIPMREDLHEDPAVLTIAHRLKTRPEHVVGYCHRFWGWAGRNMSLSNGDICPDVVPENEGQMSRFCPDAVLVGVPLSSIESVLNLPNFLSLLCEVGWLKYAESDESYDGKPVLTVPNFDRWLSQSAKSRVLATQKKRRQRCPDSVPVLSRKCPPKKGTREEKRREEYKKETPLPPLPTELDVQEFRDQLAKWLENHKPYKPVGLQAMISRAAKRAETHGVAGVVSAMEQAMSNGYQGWDRDYLFPPETALPESRVPTAEDDATWAQRAGLG